MEEGCGQLVNKVLNTNQTLIDFDYSLNEFGLEDSREIQIKLRRNKAKYDNERVKEWRERKQMRGEDMALRELYMQQNAKNEQVSLREWLRI